MKDFDQKEVSGLISKREWSEPQMTQLGVKETKGGHTNVVAESTWTNPDGTTVNMGQSA